MGRIYRYAIRHGVAEHDPTYALRGERKPPVKHYAALTEPARVARLVRAIDGYHGSPVVKAAVKLSLLLFQRPGEIRAMQWQQIDFETAEWRYIVNKTRSRTQLSHIVPLPAQALAILRELQPLTDRPLPGKPDAPRYVLPSPKTRTRCLSENAVRQALRNMGFTNDEQTAHGFRATARSLLAERGWMEQGCHRAAAYP